MARWFADSRGDAINGDRVVRAPSHRFLTPSPLACWFDGSRGDAANGPPVRPTPEAAHSLRGSNAGQLPCRLPFRRCAIYSRRPAARRHTRRSLLLSPALRCPAPPLDALFSSPLPSIVPTMAHFAGGSSSGAGSAPESNWPLSLDKPLTAELHSYGLLVPPGCRLTKPWRVSKDRYPTQDDPATPEELRTHPGDRHNINGRHSFWDGKSYYDVITRHRQAAVAAGNAGGIQLRRRATIPNPPPAALAMAMVVAPPEYELPPEQFVLHEDGDPDDSPRLLVALRASQATMAAAAREEAEIAAALAGNPAPVSKDDDDDDIDWDGLANSSDDDDGGTDGDDAVDGPGVVYLDDSD
ncbi:hypothetical protein ZWY2020_036851 [Hordeum vulgare]|nr:hypothetical protein ZWY2020_036851 [Hordeum vulgare]